MLHVKLLLLQVPSNNEQHQNTSSLMIISLINIGVLCFENNDIYVGVNVQLASHPLFSTFMFLNISCHAAMLFKLDQDLGYVTHVNSSLIM